MSIPRPKRTIPAWLSEAIETPRHRELIYFADDVGFQDDVHGELYVNKLERDVIDTPEFQRLFRISQLGFVDLVFQTANHTRGAHSIATCVVAKQLVDLVNENAARIARERRSRPYLAETPHCISFASSVLVSLGALLHDITHGPFSHDIERKKHLLNPGRSDEMRVMSHYGAYPKHDDYENHAGLYVALLDGDRSVLARALEAYSPAYWELMQLEANANKTSELAEFVHQLRNCESEWPELKKELLPNLLFHLLVFEKPQEDVSSPRKSVATSFGRKSEVKEWGLGPKNHWGSLHDAWYHPYRHDIIGNTISADLLDYLLRDMRRMGLPKATDLHFLHFYTLVRDKKIRNKVRCAIDLNDYKRGTVRIDVVNEVFRLLDARFEIHEKAVFHRVAQAASAMLSRSLLLLGEKKPSLGTLYGFGKEPISAALCGEDLFLADLIRVGDRPETQSIALKLSDRRVYRPLIVTPGDRVPFLKLVGFDTQNPQDSLRKFSALVDSAYYAPFFLFISWAIENYLEHAFDDIQSLRNRVACICDKARSDEVAEAMRKQCKRVIFWALPYKQLYKDAAVWIRVCGPNNEVFLGSLEEMAEREAKDDSRRSLVKRVKAGIEDADAKYQGIWKLYVFVSDGLFFTGTLAKLLDGHECGTEPTRAAVSHAKHLGEAQALAVEALRAAWEHWVHHSKEIRLDEACSADVFNNLLHRIAHPHEDERGENYLPHVSSVDVRQYLHAEAQSEALLQAPEMCRDARYKFGKPVRKGEIKKFLHSLGLGKEDRSRIEEFLNQLKYVLWTEEELKEVVERLRGVPEKLWRDGQLTSVAARNQENWYALQLIWRGEPDRFNKAESDAQE